MSQTSKTRMTCSVVSKCGSSKIVNNKLSQIIEQRLIFSLRCFCGGVIGYHHASSLQMETSESELPGQKQHAILDQMSTPLSKHHTNFKKSMEQGEGHTAPTAGGINVADLRKT